MKKKILMIMILLGVILLPFKVRAVDYKTLNFEEALKDEEIEPAYKEYKPSSDAVTIYLFRGKGCTYCRAFLTFLNSITDEYGKYFVVESYEVWNDSLNSALMSAISGYMNAGATGVPFIVIGDKAFTGYSEESNDKIKDAIKSLYDTKKNKRYDIMEDMAKNGDKSDNDTGKIVFSKYVVWLFIFLAVSTVIIISFVNIKFKELNGRFDKLENNKSYKSNNKNSKRGE